MTYKFKGIPDVEEFLLNSLGAELLLPGKSASEAVFFHNGDRMTVNLTNGEFIWEPIKPGEMSTSRLSLRFHQWFGKGLIEIIKEAAPEGWKPVDGGTDAVACPYCGRKLFTDAVMLDWSRCPFCHNEVVPKLPKGVLRST